jgi:hypothetical protein
MRPKTLELPQATYGYSTFGPTTILQSRWLCHDYYVSLCTYQSSRISDVTVYPLVVLEPTIVLPLLSLGFT